MPGTYISPAEIGLYYLQTRYYDPTTCRFVNADGIISTVGGSINGYNPFAYSQNNPVNMEDSSGNWPSLFKKVAKAVKKAVKKAAKTAKKAIEKLESFVKDTNFTYSGGQDFSISYNKFSASLQIGVAVDLHGNVALQTSQAGTTSISSNGLSFSSKTYRSFTGAPTVNHLEKSANQYCSSATFPVYCVPAQVSLDISEMNDKSTDETYYGATFATGITTSENWGGELGKGVSYTYTIYDFNVYDVAENICIKIMEW